MQIKKKKSSPIEEANANHFIIRCILITIFLQGIVTILDLLNIFIVDHYLMTGSFVIICVIVAVMLFIVKLAGEDRWWIKYLLIFGVVLVTTVIGVALTYHMILISVLPLLYSCQYSDRRVSVYAYVLTVISLFFIVMGGYYYGLCDANMVLLTVGSISKYVDPVTGAANFGGVNPDPWFTLPLYYVLPRALILLAVMPIVQHISEQIQKQATREASLRRLSEIDEMTQLYNRNKYLDMLEHHYPSVDKVGVIFWDVNGLKATNDNKGHEKGDLLIDGVAKTIRQAVRFEDNVFRIGGDEFVAILENVDENNVKQVVERWKDGLKLANRQSRITLSASVGYAVGAGSEIEQVVKRADAMMYKEKQQYKTHNL